MFNATRLGGQVPNNNIQASGKLEDPIFKPEPREKSSI
jgi:hypothetical protein